MPNVCICAPTRIHKVVVVGVTPCQFRTLQEALQGYPIVVREMSPARLLRHSHLECLVVVTRFVAHKHTEHAKRIATDTVRVDHGAAAAVADALISYFGFSI